MSNKYNFSKHNLINDKTDDQTSILFHIGVVTQNEDNTDSGRIKCRIKGLDDHLSDSDLLYAFPIQTKLFHITPKVGEAVFVFTPSLKIKNVDRCYIGPIISQPQFINNSQFTNGATSGLDNGFTQKKPAPSTIPENKGVYPNKEDVAIQGRDNSDIVLKSKEVLLRAGKFDVNTKFGEIPKFNFDNPSYIQIKHGVVIDKNTSTSERGGVVNVVSNKINLLTHKNGSPRFALSDQDSMISSSELDKILAEAHPMVYGDLLVNYLKLLRNALINHVHAYNGLPAEDLSGRNDVEDYLAFDLKSILSSNIKIN